ncbi:MAG TPA: hypothetical protein VEI97_04450 [bacterium]|nr:hypothetical protein [bacterium]
MESVQPESNATIAPEGSPAESMDPPTESGLGQLTYTAHTEPEERPGASADVPDEPAPPAEDRAEPIEAAAAPTTSEDTPLLAEAPGEVAPEPATLEDIEPPRDERTFEPAVPMEPPAVEDTMEPEHAPETPEPAAATTAAVPAPAAEAEEPAGGPMLGVPPELITPASNRPIDRFIALVWQDIASMAGNTFAGRRGVSMEIVQITPTGVQRKTAKGTTTEIPRSGIEWAVKQLYRNGELSRSKMTEALKENGSTIASGVFAILGQSRFFEATENPLTLHFYKLQWEEELYG